MNKTQLAVIIICTATSSACFTAAAFLAKQIKNLNKRLDLRAELLAEMEANTNPTTEDLISYLNRMDKINSMPI